MCRLFFNVGIEFRASECLFDATEDAFENTSFFFPPEQITRLFPLHQVLAKLTDKPQPDESESSNQIKIP